MNIHEFIATQGEYTDRIIGKGAINRKLLVTAKNLLGEMDDIRQDMEATFGQEEKNSMAYSWIALAFLALDGARRMGIDETLLTEAMVEATNLIKEQN